MKIIALIPARYAATRFPAKLMQDLAGMPVIARTYLACVKTGLFDAVEVVTDSLIIFDAISHIGGKARMSIRTHESGSDRIAEFLKAMDVDIVVNVQGDEPFVNAPALSQLIDQFKQDDTHRISVGSLMQVLTDEEKINDPNYVKVVVDKENFAMYFSRSPIPFVREVAQQKNAVYYEHIGVYAFRKQALLDFSSSSPTPLEQLEKIECLRFLEQGKKIKMVLTSYMGIEIDTPQDLAEANKWLQQNS